MLCVLHCLDHPDAGEVRAANRPAHLEFARGRDEIRMAGPLLSTDGGQMIGSMFVLEVDDIEQARAFNAEDPYTHAGLFQRVEVHPFRWLLGDGVSKPDAG